MKTCFVTGGSRGLGREIVLAFGRAGYSVAFCYKEDHTAAEQTRRCADVVSSQLLSFQCDVSDSRSVGEVFSELQSSWSQLDILVNNAGITSNRLMASQSVAAWEAVVATNLSGTFNCMREGAAWMCESGGGHIINVSSISGIRGREGQTAYAASKAGVVGLTKAAAIELGKSNVRVNVLLPGLLPTSMGESITAQQKEKQLSSSVLDRGGDMREVAQFVVNLGEMENVSGQVFNIDGRVLP